MRWRIAKLKCHNKRSFLMQYNVEELATLKKQIAVTVSAADVDKHITEVSARYRTSIAIPGFRKGKAPLKMIETQFGKDILSEATSNIVNKQLHDIVAELNIEPASAIEFNAGTISKGKDFSYTFTLDVMPVFDLPDYQNFPAQEEEVAIEDSEIDNILQLARRDFAEVVQVTEQRLPQDGDVVNLNMRVYDEEGKEITFFHADALDFSLGENKSFEAIEEFVKTLSVGEPNEKKLHFPDNFFNAEYAKRDLLVNIKINELKKRILPELNDEFAAKLGKYDNVQAVKNNIRESFVQARKNVNRGKAQQKLLEDLVKLVEFPLPETMLKRVASATQINKSKNMQPNADAAEIAAESKEEAVKVVREYIFLYRVAKAEKIEVSEEEILQFLHQVAARSHRSFAEVRDEYVNKNLIAEVEDHIQSDKALNLLYSKAKVEIVKPASVKPELSEAETANASVTKE
jgi:trigger factor